jgi:hypothetical protein
VHPKALVSLHFLIGFSVASALAKVTLGLIQFLGPLLSRLLRTFCPDFLTVVSVLGLDRSNV